MIYKIIMNFDNLEDIIKRTSKNWNILFCNGVLFLSSKKYKYFPQDKMKKLINYDNIFIEEITEKNLKNEPMQVKNWCVEYFVKKDMYDYEKQEQEQLRQIMQRIDLFEKELEKIDKERSE